MSQIRKGIDWFLNNSNPKEPRVIAFYGGEPLLCAGQVIEAADYASHCCGVNGDLRFAMTTNGVLLSSEIAKALCQRNFSVTVSLNGNRTSHDWARRDADGHGSFDRVFGNIKGLGDQLEPLELQRIGINAVFDPESAWYDLSGFSVLGR